MTYGPQTPFLDPDNFLFGQYCPGELKNQSHINDPVVADMLIRQRRTADVAKRREVHPRDPAPSGQAAVLRAGPVRRLHRRCGTARSRTTGPNLGYDYGGRLMAAWLER